MCAIAIIFVMTMADLGFVGFNLMSYAIDLAETNNNNIEFKAYFSDDNGALEKTAVIDKSDLKIAIEIGVKTDGYLSNARVELDQNSNFKFKTDTTSEYISSIDERAITFKQINEGDSKKVEVGIEFTNLQEFDIDYLSRTSNINLTGTYVNSRKNNTSITGRAQVKLNWTYPENIQALLSSEITTNYLVNEDGANKKIVQNLITSKIENNSFPVKDTKIELNIPGTPETVTVHKRTTSATNGDKKFNTSNYNFAEGKLTINVQNGQDDKIVWQKNVADIFIVTIKYPESAEITNSKITANSTITTYNDKVLNKNAEATITENKENYASINQIEAQNEIAKGKIYAGVNKDYITKTEVNIDYANILKKINITEKEVKALKGQEERELLVKYKDIKFKKANIQSILGDTWNITIKDQANNTKIISNETEADENGNIITNLENGSVELYIEMSKPQNVGILKYEITKTIAKTNYTRAQIKELTKIKDSNKVKYTKNDDTTNSKTAEATIDLKETESKASLKVEPHTLTTLSEQEMHITAVLETDSEYRDLFKNPVVKIKLPKQINRVSAQCNLMYGNGLTVNKFNVSEENGQEVIKINLSGEQTAYEGDAVKGATLNITARVQLDKLSTNSSEKVVMTYTNENAINYADDGQEKVNVEIVSQNSMILTNNIEEYNITSFGKEADKQLSLPVNSATKNATVKMQIVNNEESEISNIAILGKIANIAGSIERTSNVRTNIENSTVYYTSVDNPTTDINNSGNNWTQTSSANAKYFLVVITSLENGKKINLSYDLNIKANLPYNIETNASYKVTYKNNLSNSNKEAESTRIILSTGKKSEIRTTLTAKVQGKEIASGDTVKAGEIINYTAKVSNTGATNITNLKIVATIPENTTLLAINPNYPKYNEERDEYIEGEEYFNTITDRNSLTQENVTINAGKDYICSFTVMVNDNITEEKNIETKFTFSENNEKKDEKTFSNKISPAKLKIICMPYFRKPNTTLQAGATCIYGLKITNLTNEEQRNVKVLLEKSDAVEYRNIDWSIVGEGEDGESDKDEYEIELENNNTLSFNSIPANKTLLVMINTSVKSIKENDNQLAKAKLSAQAKDSNGNTYRSNEITENIVGILATIESTSNATTKVTKSGYVESGDQIKYTYKIKNTGIYDAENLTITEEISKYLDIESLKIDGANAQYELESYYSDSVDYDVITLERGLKVGEEMNIEIIGKVQSELLNDENDLQIVNNLKLYDSGILIAAKSEKVYMVEKEYSDGPGYEDPELEYPEDEDPNYENPENQEVSTFTIKGTVWKDDNNNGLRDEIEELLEGIKVYAINVETSKIATNNNEEIVATTGSDGAYSLTDLQRGNYIVVFEYDTNQYMATAYHADGVDESINSDAIKATKVINGEERTAAFTDSINVSEDIENIDLGLAENKVFSLKLNKTISKMIVTNKNGSKTYDFEDTNLAKVEIASKELSGATVVIEYKLKVTNVGEIAGYAKSIVDYLPASLTFNSSLNNDWYKKGNNLYTSSLANTLIEPGETQEVTLVLTKKMTESNTGLTNNKAEIESAYNSMGVPNTKIDTNEGSTEKEESADAIIGVKTGTAVNYVVLTLTTIIIICGMAYLVNKKLLIDKIEI